MKKIFLLSLLLTMTICTAFAEDSPMLTGIVAASPDASADTPLWETHIAFEADAATKYGMHVDVHPVQEGTGLHLIAMLE